MSLRVGEGEDGERHAEKICVYECAAGAWMCVSVCGLYADERDTVHTHVSVAMVRGVASAENVDAQRSNDADAVARVYVCSGCCARVTHERCSL